MTRQKAAPEASEIWPPPIIKQAIAPLTQLPLSLIGLKLSVLANALAVGCALTEYAGFWHGRFAWLQDSSAAGWVGTTALVLIGGIATGGLILSLRNIRTNRRNGHGIGLSVLGLILNLTPLLVFVYLDHLWVDPCGCDGSG